MNLKDSKTYAQKILGQIDNIDTIFRYEGNEWKSDFVYITTALGYKFRIKVDNPPFQISTYYTISIPNPQPTFFKKYIDIFNATDCYGGAYFNYFDSKIWTSEMANEFIDAVSKEAERIRKLKEERYLENTYNVSEAMK